jgi:hypothetical protein
MLKNHYVRGSVVCILAGLFLTSVASAVPTNGTFNPEDGLDGWTVVPPEVEGTSITNNGGYALFREPLDYSPISLESEVFTLPAGSFVLSFDRIFDFNGGSPGTDSFTASLLNADTLDPLTVYPSDPYDPGITWFYSIDTTGAELIDPSAGSVNDIGGKWWRVTFNFSLLEETDVLLAFDFFSQDDEVTTIVSLDNVKVNVIPAPAALLLGLIGAGLVGLLRRSRHEP